MKIQKFAATCAKHVSPPNLMKRCYECSTSHLLTRACPPVFPLLYTCKVAETMSPEELAELQAPPKSDYPVIDAHTLPEADGFVFGFPT